jgi:hypothetical protein
MECFHEKVGRGFSAFRINASNFSQKIFSPDFALGWRADGERDISPF